MMKCRIMLHYPGCSMFAKVSVWVFGPKRVNDILQMADYMNIIELDSYVYPFCCLCYTLVIL